MCSGDALATPHFAQTGKTLLSSWLRVVVQLLFKEHPKGRCLTWLLCLLTLAGHIGLAFTPRVALPGDNLPSTSPRPPSVTSRHVESASRTWGDVPFTLINQKTINIWLENYVTTIILSI
ncbi:hypothetical protein AVEN_21951-1 [Araneus ventricosus]|uniref:Uncharacterized protein n=1 Tax=Araneus ventricosus TaxID=182803 RepID=A0A4Y2UGY0_ARAVE|nr:hypothetical protein AVEN_163669-1 [Araneus ventricosus]GBO10870.1 hypothetical protein AVEN_21951-1 [Araneus ventricosus]